MALGAGVLGVAGDFGTEDSAMKKGYGIKETGLFPAYPDDFKCPPLTSLYASWIDVDGTHRDEKHTGVDGGGLGDWIIAPADGTVLAAWEANWKWGAEGALLISHSSKDVNLTSGSAYYYSEFDHLNFDEVKKLKPGDRVKRGQRLARVYRPGGHSIYLPEVHWEVWEASDEDIKWATNDYKALTWSNRSAVLIDPLYMLGLHAPPADNKTVMIRPFVRGEAYNLFPGFTYIFECRQRQR